ncbi:MAG TPA: DUF5666 domain-containing protein [Thermoanaerobaculia bacterium]|jgi:hypothetical protein|nr:DUF5666 domain-containing protein [Thermoanaerobaculia bacterium]
MTRNARFPAFLALVLICAVPVCAQYVAEGARGSMVGTVADVDEARGQILMDPDDSRGPRITVLSDSVSTQYNGFGGVINGQPEIFTGSQGLANVRTGDRIDVRGTGQANYAIRADVITLLGRPTAAPQTGVGTTRSPTSVSTPTASTTAQTARVSPVEGTIQDVNANDGRLVIVTARREVMTVRVSSATPVTYRGNSYRISNLEVGDKVRINPDPSTSATAGDELRASSIEVTTSVQEGANVPKTNLVSGRVASTDRSLDMVTLDTGRQSIRIDVATASDPMGRRVRAADFRQGDRIEVNGRYSATGTDLFIANVVRWVDESAPAQPSGATEEVVATNAPAPEFAAVTIYGSVTETLANSPQLVLRDNAGRTVVLNVLDDFVVRGPKTYTTAGRLKAGQNVVVKAFRDQDGNYIAQTIRLR